MVDLTLFAVPVFLVTMIAEAVSLRRHPEMKGYDSRDTRASLTMGIGNVVIKNA